MTELHKILGQFDSTGFPSDSEHIYCATDDPKFWLNHVLKDHPNVAVERSKTYSYKYNNHGFRCDEFTTKSELPIVFLGCSHTSGVGLEIQDVWSSVLLEKIKNYTGKTIPFWNLAIPGSSIDRQATVLEKYIHKLNPKLIFFSIPSMFRRHIVLEDHVIDYRPTRMDLHTDEYGDRIIRNLSKAEYVLLDEKYAAFESYKNLRLINTLAILKNSKIYYHTGVENQTDNWYERPQNDNSQTPNWNIIQTMCDKLSNFNNLDLPFVLSDLARDGSHLGKISHRKFAESVFEKIKDRL
jgi:hypothetical protein